MLERVKILCLQLQLRLQLLYTNLLHPTRSPSSNHRPTQVSSQSQREHETRILWYPTTDQGSSRFCSLRSVGDQARMLATSGHEIRHTWVPRMLLPPHILTSNQNLPFHSPISPKPFLGVVDLPTSVASFSPPEIRHFFSFLVFEPSLNPPLFTFVQIQMLCFVF